MIEAPSATAGSALLYAEKPASFTYAEDPGRYTLGVCPGAQASRRRHWRRQRSSLPFRLICAKRRSRCAGGSEQSTGRRSHASMLDRRRRLRLTAPGDEEPEALFLHERFAVAKPMPPLPPVMRCDFSSSLPCCSLVVRRKPDWLGDELRGVVGWRPDLLDQSCAAKTPFGDRWRLPPMLDEEGILCDPRALLRLAVLAWRECRREALAPEGSGSEDRSRLTACMDVLAQTPDQTCAISCGEIDRPVQRVDLAA